MQSVGLYCLKLSENQLSASKSIANDAGTHDHFLKASQLVQVIVLFLEVDGNVITSCLALITWLSLAIAHVSGTIHPLEDLVL